MTGQTSRRRRDRAAEVPVGSNRTWTKVVILLLFMVLAIVFLVPMYWMVVSSFRTQGDLF